MVALADEQHRRTYRSGWLVSSVGFTFAGVGALGWLGGSRDGGTVGMALGGAALVTTSQYEMSLGRRRHASLLARLAEVEGREGAIRALAADMRRDADRSARTHALATGIWTTVLVAGVSTFAADPDTRGNFGLGLATTAIGGVFHHAARWRAASRFSADYDTLWNPPPTVVPEPRR
ncbi:MAG: hypothetical protein H6734_21205 [Alphaproteobacteria bacterium]|nr:hypothetical protein [Alphaproteobacteria bacterium]